MKYTEKELINENMCFIIMNSHKTKTKKIQKVVYGNQTITKKNPYFGQYNIYSNPKPNDTVRIKYSTLNDVIFTIKKLENLYKRKLRPHARISKIANVLEQRLRVIKDMRNLKKTVKTKKIKNPKQIKKNSISRFTNKDIYKRHKLAKRYFKFLKMRTSIKNDDSRRRLEFII